MSYLKNFAHKFFNGNTPTPKNEQVVKKQVNLSMDNAEIRKPECIFY
jgi:hypothetical protein